MVYILYAYVGLYSSIHFTLDIVHFVVLSFFQILDIDKTFSF